jgi:hypothetical protein
MRKRTKTNLYSFLSECCLGRNRDRFMPQGFSLVHVLLIVFLIVLVISIILPSTPHRHKLYAYIVKQKYQFKSIETALELFKNEFNGYPPSDALDENGKSYCGAMKLGEAMMGQDLMGFHPDSIFRSDGTDGKGTLLYPDANNLSKEAYSKNRSVRKGRYLPLENANMYRLRDLYKNVGPFDGNDFVVCDISRRVKHIRTGRKTGMPILYYKADTSKTAHDVNDPNNPENIYDYRDNQALLALGVPGRPGLKHPLYENPKIFYEMTRDYQFAKTSKPQRADSFILLSTGRDGLYGTKDDIANFDMQWKPK